LFTSGASFLIAHEYSVRNLNAPSGAGSNWTTSTFHATTDPH